jgi:hypothetical protein
LASWVPPGWYPDPLGIGAARYWDGTQWTKRYRDAPPPQPVPAAPDEAPGATPTTAAPAPAKPAKPRRPIWQNRWLWGAGGVLVLIIAIGAATSGSNHSSSSTPAHTTGKGVSHQPATHHPAVPESQKEALAYLKDHEATINRVAAEVGAVHAAVEKAAKSESEADLNEVAKLAQEAHNNLDAARTELASGEPEGKVGEAALEVFSSTNGLKNSMGALVAYTGNPNPATLAHFTTQFQPAANEWNTGVMEIWRLAGKSNPPIL